MTETATVALFVGFFFLFISKTLLYSSSSANYNKVSAGDFVVSTELGPVAYRLQVVFVGRL